jgi:hypothetical protein
MRLSRRDHGLQAVCAYCDNQRARQQPSATSARRATYPYAPLRDSALRDPPVGPYLPANTPVRLLRRNIRALQRRHEPIAGDGQRRLGHALRGWVRKSLFRQCAAKRLSL